MLYMRTCLRGVLLRVKKRSLAVDQPLTPLILIFQGRRGSLPHPNLQIEKTAGKTPRMQRSTPLTLTS